MIDITYQGVVRKKNEEDGGLIWWCMRGAERERPFFKWSSDKKR